MNAIKTEIARWSATLPLNYSLTIEPEVFWRLGAPQQPTASRASEGR
jgi:hypothetical protein